MKKVVVFAILTILVGAILAVPASKTSAASKAGTSTCDDVRDAGHAYAELQYQSCLSLDHGTAAQCMAVRDNTYLSFVAGFNCTASPVTGPDN